MVRSSFVGREEGLEEGEEEDGSAEREVRVHAEVY